MSTEAPYSTVALPDGVVIGGKWPDTMIAWPGGKGRGATKPEHDLFQALERMRAERDGAVNQLLDMRAERDALAERLRGSAELRETVATLRQILRDLDDGLPEMSRRRLERLLRRLDESPNTTTTP